MAKAIAEKLFENRRLKYRVDIRAVGLGPVDGSIGAEYAARYVINEMYGEDLLKNHKPTQITSELIKNATLILVMEEALLMTKNKVFPKDKTFVLKKFCGSTTSFDMKLSQNKLE